MWSIGPRATRKGRDLRYIFTLSSIGQRPEAGAWYSISQKLPNSTSSTRHI